MPTTKRMYVLDDAPDFFIGQLPGKSNHAGTDRSVLDHPADFAFSAMAPESVMLEIARRWIQLGSQRPIAAPVFPMTVEAGALAVIQRFALFDDLRGARQRACECARFSQFVGRDYLLHHMSFGGSGGNGKRNHCDYQWKYTLLHHLAPLIVDCGEPGQRRRWCRALDMRGGRRQFFPCGHTSRSDIGFDIDSKTDPGPQQIVPFLWGSRFRL